MTKEQIEKAAKEYSGLTDNPKDSDSRVKGSLCIAFKDGAYWRINSVWHSHAIKPDKGKLLIVEDIDGAYDLVYLTKNKPWEELSEKNHYMSWAYIEDLLPNTEE